MWLTRLSSCVVLPLVQLMAVVPAASQEALDLTLEPDDLEQPQTPTAHDYGEAAPRWSEPGPGEPGWSVRPEIELDVETGDGEEVLRSLDPELESLGLRLKRTW